MTEAIKINRREVAKAATRAKLLAAARDLWAMPGSYEAIGIREVSGHIGMSTGAVFANWDSKADLWREAMGYEPPVDGPAVREALIAQSLQIPQAA